MLVDVDRVGLAGKVVRLDDLALARLVALCVIAQAVLPCPARARPQAALGALDGAVLAQDGAAVCACAVSWCSGGFCALAALARVEAVELEAGGGALEAAEGEELVEGLAVGGAQG